MFSMYNPDGIYSIYSGLNKVPIRVSPEKGKLVGVASELRNRKAPCTGLRFRPRYVIS